MESIGAKKQGIGRLPIKWMFAARGLVALSPFSLEKLNEREDDHNKKDWSATAKSDGKQIKKTIRSQYLLMDKQTFEDRFQIILFGKDENI